MLRQLSKLTEGAFSPLDKLVKRELCWLHRLLECYAGEGC